MLSRFLSVVHIRYLFAVVIVADVRGLQIAVLGVGQRCRLLFTSGICLQLLFTSGIVAVVADDRYCLQLLFTSGIV